MTCFQAGFWLARSIAVGSRPIQPAAPLVALDLPLRVLVADDGGQAVVSYVAPSYLAERYGIPPDLVKNIAGIEKIVEEVVV